MASLTSDRIRNASKHLEQDARRIQSDTNAHTILFKLVAEDIERQNDSESVAKLRQGLLEVIESANLLEHHCSALQNVSQTFQASPEPTDFKTLLDDSTRQYLAASPSDPTGHTIFQQFNQAVWNIHHAGEAAPGQEQEEIVMIATQCELKNQRCPLSGRPVVELTDPVRSTACQHVYDRETVLDYIKKAGRRRCKCAAAGCPKDLSVSLLVCDTSLKMEIEELRLRGAATQARVVDYTEEDLEDDMDDEVDRKPSASRRDHR